MPRRRDTAEQIITKLRQAEVEIARGQSVAEVCRELGTSEQTYYGGARNTAGYESTTSSGSSRLSSRTAVSARW